MRISDWSSDVCSSDLDPGAAGAGPPLRGAVGAAGQRLARVPQPGRDEADAPPADRRPAARLPRAARLVPGPSSGGGAEARAAGRRSEEHTSELQSLMRISYAVFCLKKKKKTTDRDNKRHTEQKQE